MEKENKKKCLMWTKQSNMNLAWLGNFITPNVLFKRRAKIFSFVSFCIVEISKNTNTVKNNMNKLFNFRDDELSAEELQFWKMGRICVGQWIIYIKLKYFICRVVVKREFKIRILYVGITNLILGFKYYIGIIGLFWKPPNLGDINFTV